MDANVLIYAKKYNYQGKLAQIRYYFRIQKNYEQKSDFRWHDPYNYVSFNLLTISKYYNYYLHMRLGRRSWFGLSTTYTFVKTDCL